LEASVLTEQDQTSNLPVIVVGGGGHAKVVANALLLQHQTVLGFVDVNPAAPPMLGIINLGNDDKVFDYSPDLVRLVNGVGSIKSTALRQTIYEKFVAKQYSFETVIHPNAVVSLGVEVGAGVQIMAGAVIQPGSSLGINAIVNTGACVDHDCVIEAHAHIAPGATLSGGVHVGKGSQIGTGATIIQGIKIGASSIVGAGAVVIRDVPDGVTVAGVPAVLLTSRVASRP
jgi:sugar O-acyltransferase (sialic acid O-acetyltransferase NeuD family)